MTLLSKNFIASIALALSDFFSFTISLYISISIISVFSSDYEVVPVSQTDGWVALHWLLALCCVGWYSVRLRHYFYRKTFWFELKEILRTLVIFAIIEIAVMAFTTWSFSRFLWVLTWVLIFILVPVARMITKRVLDIMGVWQRDTWIIGSGVNAIDAYKAISGERNLGLNIIGFISSEGGITAGEQIDNIPVLPNEIKWLSTMDTRTQFIVAVESH